MLTELSFYTLGLFAFGLRYVIPNQSNYQLTLVVFSLAYISFYDYKSAFLLVLIALLTYYAQKFKNRNWQYGAIGIIILLITLHTLPIKISFLSGIGLSYYGLQFIGLLLLPPKEKQTFKDVLIGAAFLPKFFAGPILAKNKFLASHKSLEEDFYYGFQRILFGLFKKFVLATRLDFVLSGYFDAPMVANNQLLVIFSVVIYTLELYLSFSAYMDIAIGLGRWMGIQLPENFRLPMRAKSITDYWRRTHITLIGFFTEHFYYPITYVFRKHKVWPAVLGVFLTFIVSGVWHKFQLGFLIWGLLNALFITIELLFKISKKLEKLKISNLLWVIPLVSMANFFFKLPSADFLEIFTHHSSLPFWPKDVMADFVATIGKGAYLAQQFHLLETLLLTLLFFLFEKRLEKYFMNDQIKITRCVLIILGILLFGKFADSSSFIYLQF